MQHKGSPKGTSRIALAKEQIRQFPQVIKLDRKKISLTFIQAFVYCILQKAISNCVENEIWSFRRPHVCRKKFGNGWKVPTVLATLSIPTNARYAKSTSSL